MDASETFAAVSAIIIVGVWWTAMTKYFYSYDQSDNSAHLYSWTFHVESLRFYGFLAFVCVLIIGYLITEKSGLDTIPDPETTVIYKIFKFNHSCNLIDHNPAKMIAATLLTPFCQLPMMLYCIIWHIRLATAYKDGKVSKWLLDLSRIITPFTFITMAELHLWFVNGPAETYGFVAHYIPYMMFQISIINMMLLNILYLASMNSLPFGIPVWLAHAYCIAFTVLSIICIIFVVTTLSSGVGFMEDIVLDYLSPLWVIGAIFGTLIFAYIESKDGNDLTITIGNGGVALASADGRGGYGSV